MKSLFSSLAICALGGALVSVLSGCGVAPEAASLTGSGPVGTAQLGSIQGSNFGGHAPLVGAHIFVLEAYTSASGYYQPAKSLLNASYTGSYPTAVEPAGTAVAGDYYVTTDSKGYFGVSGDYTCDAGYPVYLYAEGGNPQAPTATSGAVSITAASVAAGTGAYAGQYIISFNASSLVYQGESLTFTGSGGNLGKYLNGATYSVLADANLTTTTFDIAVSSLTANGVTLATGTQSSIGTITALQAAAPSNPAVVNLTMLGVCPSTGASNFSYLNFVYSNEVSTTAMTYAMAGFFPAPGNSALAVAGAAAANLSIPQSDALALLGLQNAALTASQLYDIQGSVSACSGSTPPCDGETHIALSTTPGLLTGGATTAGSATVTGVFTTAGLATGMAITGSTLPAGETIAAIGTNMLTLSTATGVTSSAGASVNFRAGSGSGTVPQSLLNTIGNILANCVDSANSSSQASPQCSTLFSNTRSAGTSGTLPVDTATAAIDIAHNPWANVTSLIASPSGNAPFVPSLTTANDLSVGITYNPAHGGHPEGMSIDRFGRMWFGNPITGYVTALNPFGGVQFNVAQGGTPHYLTIDASGSNGGTGQVWDTNSATGHNGLYAINEVTGAPILFIATPNGTTVDVDVASDGVTNSGFIYTGGGSTGVYKYNNIGTQATSPGNPLNGSLPASCTGATFTFQASHLAADAVGNVWVSQEFGPICEVNTGTGALTNEVNLSTTLSPEKPGIDASNTAWIPEQFGNALIYVTQAGVATQATGTLSRPFSAAVDGAGNIFVTNRTTNNIAEFLGSTKAVVSSAYFQGGGNVTTMNGPLNGLVDQSGNYWVTNYNNNSVTELVGIGAPTVQPLADAIYNGKLGSKP